MRIVTHYDASSLFPSTDWSAVDDDTYDLDEPCGYGATEKEAIDDLMEQIEERKPAFWGSSPTPEELSRSASGEAVLIWTAYWAWRAA